MKKVVHKTFLMWNCDKEQKWLNEMSEQGWILIRVGLFTYEFEQGEKGKYQFAMDFFDVSKKSEDYIKFIEETGVKYVGQMNCRMYFRKEKNSEYDFNMYSDNTSKVKYLKGRMITPLLFALVNFECGFVNCFVVNHSVVNNVIGIMNLLVGFLCVHGAYKICKKREELIKNLSKTTM